MKITDLQGHLDFAFLKHGNVEVVTHADGAVSNLGYVKFHSGELHLFDKMYGDKSWSLCHEESFGKEPKQLMEPQQIKTQVDLKAAIRAEVLSNEELQLSAARLMCKRGGRFIGYLGSAFVTGDPVNRLKLVTAFPDDFARYADMHQRINDQ